MIDKTLNTSIMWAVRQEDRAMLGSNPSACPDAEAGAEGWLARLSLPLLICFGFKAKNPKNELSLHRSAIWQYLWRGAPQGRGG